MRILVAQLNPTIGDLEGNTQKIIQVLDRARKHNADIVLCAELSLCGYPPEDLLLHNSFIEAMEMCLKRIIGASAGLMVIVGLARISHTFSRKVATGSIEIGLQIGEDSVGLTRPCLSEGQDRSTQCANFPKECEKCGLVRRNLSSGEKPLLNSAAVIHDGKLLGYQDKWLLPTYDVFDERRYFEPGTDMNVWELKGKKIGVIICEDIWQHSGEVGSTSYSRDPILELVPHKPDLLLNLSASPYQFQKPDVRVKVCSKAARSLRCPVILCCEVGGNDELVFDGYSVYVDAEGQLRQLAAGFQEDEMLVDLDAPACPCPFHYDPIKDLYQALVLGVRDYFHKSGFKRGCLGLSGGIDSSLVACIAVDALGRENVLGIAMPSRYSSPESLSDAKKLAENLGIEFQQISIEEPFEDYLKLLEPHFLGKGPDVTEENLQSRIRGMILMAISNKLGYIVLSTGNKSEMAMGYCTLYGDMCGGVSVIADVTKTQVYTLSRWINREKEIIPISCIEKPPSAELRPNQKDSDSLPDYEIVDTILQGYVEDYLSPDEIALKYQLPVELVLDLVRRIHRAEYKRRQAAPGIRVTKKAFRIGRRYPIVQGWI